jgi:nitroreductase
MNPTIETILTRRSVRSYQHKSLSREIIDCITLCGINAPTAWHRESWAIRVVQNSENLQKLNESCLNWLRNTQSGVAKMFKGPEASVFYHAPVVIIIAGEKEFHFSPVDCALAGENMMIAAQALEVGSCAIGFISEFLKTDDGEIWKEFFKIPATHESIIAIAFGYASSPKKEKAQRDTSKIIFT